MSKLTYRAVEAEDCAALVALHQRAFTPWAIETSIFASPRIENYLRQVTSVPPVQREQFLWGAWNDEQLIGYAFGRALPSSWHLNYLAVAPEVREQGIGSSLWDLWVEEGQARGLREYSLDVWQSNEIARPWYKRKGCRVVSKSWVCRRALRTDINPSGSWRWLNWENAAAWQACYGFSRFEIAHEGKCWTIARVGEKLFRATEVLPAEVEAMLHQREPERSLLLSLPQPHGEDAKISLRLAKSD